MASLSMGKAVSCEKNNMSGLYIGIGANVGYDEYDARANVGQACGYSVTVENTANSTDVLLTTDDPDANNLVTKLWECGKEGAVQDISIGEGDGKVTIVSSKNMEKEELVTGLHYSTYNYEYCLGDGSVTTASTTHYVLSSNLNDAQCSLDKIILLEGLNYCYAGLHFSTDCEKSSTDGQYTGTTDWSNFPNYYYKYNGGTTVSGDLWLNENEVKGCSFVPVKVCKRTIIPKSVITSNKATYLMSQSLNRSGHNAGGEMKMAYFHDFGNHIMAGLDLTGAVLSKNKRNVHVSKFNVNDVYPELTLKSVGIDIAKAVYNNDKQEYQTETIGANPQITSKSQLTLSSNYEDFKSAAMQANPGMQVSIDPVEKTYLDVSNGNKDVSFEKGIFNPKLAFVVGGTYNGWFAGVRAGVSYNTGKIKAPDMTSSKSVSIASPLVGVQVMKKVSDNTNLYMTADWNVGDLRKSVDMNGIKSFKQSSYSISAGVQWRCNFIK